MRSSEKTEMDQPVVPTNHFEPRQTANDRAGALAELLARVEAATGADRELDFAIYRIAFNAKQVGGDSGVREAWLPGYVYPHEAKPYTASLDAALALVERVLPGWWWDIDCRGCAHLGPEFTPLNMPPASWGKTPALALLAALLRALQSSAEPTDGPKGSHPDQQRRPS